MNIPISALGVELLNCLIISCLSVILHFHSFWPFFLKMSHKIFTSCICDLQSFRAEMTLSGKWLSHQEIIGSTLTPKPFMKRTFGLSNNILPLRFFLYIYTQFDILLIQCDKKSLQDNATALTYHLQHWPLIM